MWERFLCEDFEDFGSCLFEESKISCEGPETSSYDESELSQVKNLRTPRVTELIAHLKGLTSLYHTLNLSR